MLPQDQRPVVGRAPSELGAGRFADWPRGAGAQALAIAWPEGRSELPQRSAASSVWGERRWRIPPALCRCHAAGIRLALTKEGERLVTEARPRNQHLLSEFREHGRESA